MLYHVPSRFNHDVFRTYDIRGPVADDAITPNLSYAIGRAIAAEALPLGQTTVIVGRDGRLSGPLLMEALQQGIRDAGCDVVDVGVVSSPVLYFATKTLPFQTGVMLTASHNPSHHNGYKIVLNGTTLSTEGVQVLRERIARGDLPQSEQGGSVRSMDVAESYQQAILDQISLSRPLRIVVDSGNGMGAPFATPLYEAMGCEVIGLYETVDGSFPNHHPDPTIPENLDDLKKAVVDHQADIGLAFDGDADRLGVVTNTGDVIWPDRQMMLFAQSVLKTHPGQKIVFDIKCSTQLADVISASGGTPIMSQTGHSIIKSCMYKENAPLAGEMSGHIFFCDKWFGFDDGVYVGARLLELLAAQSGSAQALFDAFPQAVFTPELKLPMPEDQKSSFMESLLAMPHFDGGRRLTLDGLRVEWSHGWGLVRRSNTSAYLTLRFEGETPEALNQVQTCFEKAMLAVDPDLQFPWQA